MEISTGRYRNIHDELIYRFWFCGADNKGVLVKHERYRENGDFVSKGVQPVEAFKKVLSFGCFALLDLNAPVASLEAEISNQKAEAAKASPKLKKSLKSTKKPQ